MSTWLNCVEKNMREHETLVKIIILQLSMFFFRLLLARFISQKFAFFIVTFSFFLGQIYALKCNDERKTSLEKTFVSKQKVADSDQYKSCAIRVLYDPAPEEVAVVTHYGETTQKDNSCEYKDSVERWDEETREFVKDEMYTITCYCSTNKCNIPELVMKYLDESSSSGPVREQKTKILNSMIDVMDRTKQPDDSVIKIHVGIIIALVVPMMLIMILQTVWTGINVYRSYKEFENPEIMTKLKKFV